MPTASRSGRSIGAFLLALALLAAVAPTSSIALEPSRLGAPGAADREPVAAVTPATSSSGGRREVMRLRGQSPAVLAALGRAAAVDPDPRPRLSAPKPARLAAAKQPAPTARSFRGRNHVWIPALGVDRSIAFFACSRATYPGNRVYRWGCAGSNNVYLFGHAHSVFKPLHDAYVRGRLRKGMKVFFANANGNVSTYSVRWWRVTTPDKGEFAFASQKRPSLTLQTCVGKKSQYRLIVRLLKV